MVNWRHIALALGCTVIVAVAADKPYYQFNTTTAIRDGSRFLVYDTLSGSRNITGAALKAATATDVSSKLDTTIFRGYTATRRVTAARMSSYSASRQTEINARLLASRFSSYSSGHGTADKIPYSNPGYPLLTSVDAALGQLLYVAPGSPSVSGGGTYETGQTITSVALTWTISLGSKALTSQSIDNGIGSLPVADRSYTHSGQSITTNRTYTVSITDGTTPRSGSTTVSFSRKRHWGATTTTLASFTSSDILALASNEFSTSHSKSVTYDCTGGKYPTFAFVATAGTLTATTVGGLSFSDYSYRTISHTNASGNTTNYYVYQFNSLQNGSAINVVWD